MFPSMVNEMIDELISVYRNTALGWKVSGAGGGGYLILVSEQPIENGIKVYIRRKNNI
jgi:galactokinase/mevalonate kinase-like predicted kinase